VLDGAGTRLVCEAVRISRKEIELRVRRRETIPTPSFELTLFQAIVKGKTMETIVEKATELGVSRVVPLLTERVVSHLDSERTESKQAKWQLTAIESIKQCGSPWLPQIDAPVKLHDALKDLPPFELACVASLRGGKHLRHWFQELKQVHTGCVWIGPEGDFTDAELDAVEAAGAKPITLGPLVLRADTAAIASLSILRSEADWLTATGPTP
jgi:16S rRNA (uracil1498-N3)-methyltransferase